MKRASKLDGRCNATTLEYGDIYACDILRREMQKNHILRSVEIG